MSSSNLIFILNPLSSLRIELKPIKKNWLHRWNGLFEQFFDPPRISTSSPKMKISKKLLAIYKLNKLKKKKEKSILLFVSKRRNTSRWKLFNFTLINQCWPLPLAALNDSILFQLSGLWKWRTSSMVFASNPLRG